MKIVTDGIHFRIKKDNGEFVSDYHSSPDGYGYCSVFQTRFYGRALKRFGREIKNEVFRDREPARWTEV